ncbi:30S ribosomal protein S1 [Morus notabilis]|uniref:30S ribosomal protein S1 n=1 Tax=Morus notabilis TaxID=981085 RepID=W9RML0_9ROSA|nr:30S ribosomal protein S1 [Morus notabilis]
MPLFTATPALVSLPPHLSFLSQLLTSSDSSSVTHCFSVSALLIPHSSSSSSSSCLSKSYSKKSRGRRQSRSPVCAASDVSKTEPALLESPASTEAIRQARRSADWKAARTYNEGGFIYEGRIEGFNGGGLLIRFRSLVIQADEEKRKLIFSEKEAEWSKFSEQVKVGDIFEGKVGSVEDYGAFVHLQFSDDLYHLTGLVHVSEVSWDLVQDVRDILTEGNDIRVKVLTVDREKSRITLSIKQLEEDPLLETLDKVIPQEDSDSSDSLSISNGSNIEPLPGLETIFEELLREDGIDDVRITRQGFEKRVVSQDLQLWLSNAPTLNQKFTLLARAGRQVQEIQLTTSLDQEGIKKALQRVLERVP